MRAVMSVLASALLAACSVVGVRGGTEQPDYEVVEAISEDVEVRRYAPRLAASVTVPGGDTSETRNKAFKILAGYIFGGNRSKTEISMTAPVESTIEAQEIAMTAPVESAAGGGTYTMRFFLPATLTAETAPEPLDSRVRIETVPAETLAVLRFTGARDSGMVGTEKLRLRAELHSSAWEPVGEPVAYFYDPPWTLPWFRRNEVVVPVKAR